MGRVALDRNTPSLMNVGTHRWFGWAGDSDNLWAQSLLPILNADELASDAQSLKTMMADGPYASTYAQLFELLTTDLQNYGCPEKKKQVVGL